MKTNYLIYYILKLITKGQEWQYKNLNGQGQKPKFYFTSLQWVAIVISFLFVYTKPTGFSNEIVDYVLSSLSIMTALFLSLIIVIFDKFNNFDFKAEDDKEKVHKFHMWNFFYQFNAITSYAILISSIVIVLLILTLLFGKEIDVSKYELVSLHSLNKESILLFLKLLFVYLVRFVIVYFLLDFFILCIYAISAIFQYVSNEFMKKNPNIKVNREETIDITLEKEYGKLPQYLKIVFIISFLLAVLYLFL
ncbi:hypothetical protein [Dysgonomonas mossii]|uniref:hypothetical protein n=1 Tax=Dysgonomonas mossii TaxID=163665 RepID=UPI0039919540